MAPARVVGRAAVVLLHAPLLRNRIAAGGRGGRMQAWSSGWRTVILDAIVVAVAAGVGAGYLLWGRGTDWYAGEEPGDASGGRRRTTSSATAATSSCNTATIIGKSASDPGARLCRQRPQLYQLPHQRRAEAVRGPVRVDLCELPADGRRPSHDPAGADQRLHDPQHERQADAGGRPRDGRRSSPISATSATAHRKVCGSPAWA